MEDAEMCEMEAAPPSKSCVDGTPKTRKAVLISKQDAVPIMNGEGTFESNSPPGIDVNQNQKVPEKDTDKSEKEEVVDDGLTEEEYEVEKILKRRCTEDGRSWLYVKWLGWDNKFNTWEQEDRMDEVEQYEHFLKNFEQKRFLPPGTKGANVKGFDRSLLVDSIIGAKCDDGKHLFLVKWKEVDFTEWVPAEDADSCCPKLVIDFYEKFILWSKPRGENLKPISSPTLSNQADTSPGKASVA